MGLFKRAESASYYVEFEYKGRRVRESCNTTNKAKAEAYERKRRQELYEEIVLGRPNVPNMTLREAVDRYVLAHLRFKIRRPKTAGNDSFLLNKMIEFFGGDDMPLRNLTTPVIARIRDHTLVKGRQASTVNRYLANLKAILRQPHRNWGTLAILPIIQLLPLNNKRMRWLTADEEVALLDACSQQHHLQRLPAPVHEKCGRLPGGEPVRGSTFDRNHNGRNQCDRDDHDRRARCRLAVRILIQDHTTSVGTEAAVPGLNAVARRWHQRLEGRISEVLASILRSPSSQRTCVHRRNHLVCRRAS